VRIKKGNNWKVVFTIPEGLFEPIFWIDKFTSHIPGYDK